MQSRKVPEIIDLSSDDEPVAPPKAPVEVSVPIKALAKPPVEPVKQPVQEPLTAAATPSAEVFVTVESAEMAEQVKFLQALKQRGPAKDCKICISCWQLVTASDTPQHLKHSMTGSFEQMAGARKESLQQLCQSKGKCRTTNSNFEVQLFSESTSFKEQTQHLKTNKPATPVTASQVIQTTLTTLQSKPKAVGAESVQKKPDPKQSQSEQTKLKEQQVGSKRPHMEIEKPEQRRAMSQECLHEQSKQAARDSNQGTTQPDSPPVGSVLSYSNGNPVLLKEFDSTNATKFQAKVISLLETISGQLHTLEQGLKRPCM